MSDNISKQEKEGYLATDYRELLGSIENVRKKLGSSAIKLNLPQKVVIGDQSSGKSSLLTELTGIPFPTNSGMTTKCPIIVHTEHDNSLEEPKYVIKNDGEVHEIVEEELSDKILEIQEDILGTSKVINMPITIFAVGKKFEDLVLVDLPGIISNGPGQEEVIDMIEKYIKPKQSLILVITEAKQDHETAKALELAMKYDPDKERTLRILTKYDMFDTAENKERARNLVLTIDDLSPHAIICRPSGESYSLKKEEKELSDAKLPKERAGIQSLKARLPKLLCNLIKTNLPGLKTQIKNNLKETTEKLKEIGEQEPDNTRILFQVQSRLTKNVDKVSILLTESMTTFREQIHKTSTEITKELIEEHYHPDAFQCIFFQGDRTFNALLDEIIKWWKPIVDDLYKKVEGILKDLFDILHIQGISKNSLKCINNSWIDYRQTLLDNLKKQLDDELSKETRFKTMNHYLTSKYQEKLLLPDELLEEIISSITLSTVCNLDHPTKKKKYASDYDSDSNYEVHDLEIVKDNIKELITTTIENNAEKFNREPIEEQHKRRVLAAVRANWSVSHKNLIDNILVANQNIIINMTKRWVKRTLIEDDTINKNTCEDPRIKTTRKEYNKIIETMRTCIQILQKH